MSLPVEHPYIDRTTLRITDHVRLHPESVNYIFMMETSKSICLFTFNHFGPSLTQKRTLDLRDVPDLQNRLFLIHEVAQIQLTHCCLFLVWPLNRCRSRLLAARIYWTWIVNHVPEFGKDLAAIHIHRRAVISRSSRRMINAKECFVCPPEDKACFPDPIITKEVQYD
jgi:hypothetical protein